jgi:T-complex protein 1 subunit beta
MIPTILVDNAGWDSSELVAKLRRHFAAFEGEDAEGKIMRLDIEIGDIGDMRALGSQRVIS